MYFQVKSAKLHKKQHFYTLCRSLFLYLLIESAYLDVVANPCPTDQEIIFHITELH